MAAPRSYSYIAHNLEETAALAAVLAAKFQPSTVVTLDGELGAGKTAFSQAVARTLGVKGIVNSPTFTIIKEYQGEKLPLYHMDVYRLTTDEAHDLGLDEYFYGFGVTLIEWASLIEDLLPADRLTVRVQHSDNQSRLFELIPHGEPYISWCEQLKESGILQ
ncbi:tRNA (adenosine(37)-N6)-threonylcarbamoyltransferase complex ATPase subunit type 1 TsaE [Paenibacillus xerothermodurans]|uniref:tRNA threonylcarbamoyladenosine biosynthesis protein TsaE n=1 Tax=Paenibacillus xerothermodurans TaxID=1977292 RepID=A0A2W1N8Z2_PAEXE|nr:tRNA (adenosine(37)-N6)-threonylcarbamoyltransferase complex ATPase subunit type 1 TsaE [Paenibacillus xerothermodurans]PZE19611.1 tRNA (adenosine(37)-N6)-threonylcarbamoyltransferase complex ATPase subunit type 1 TsaE [Paenibacillus xerothermodurans]